MTQKLHNLYTYNKIKACGLSIVNRNVLLVWQKKKKWRETSKIRKTRRKENKKIDKMGEKRWCR